MSYKEVSVPRNPLAGMEEGKCGGGKHIRRLLVIRPSAGCSFPGLETSAHAGLGDGGVNMKTLKLITPGSRICELWGAYDNPPREGSVLQTIGTPALSCGTFVCVCC
ncbi:hypothetical protein F2P79_019918 [Pimephales promelas]|nr:hypothetical protein F2P79_019918 [Pimephales promelas]